MKSIMEEASSVAKAIEKGWQQAGKPQEFSIKVFEEPTKNFLGFTTKSAKIGIFFNEKITQQPRASWTPHHEQKPAVKKAGVPQNNAAGVPQNNNGPKQQAPRQQAPRAVRPEQEQGEQGEKKQRDVWSTEMIEAAQAWVHDTLAHMGKGAIPFTVSAKNYYLKINFSAAVLPDSEKERALFRNVAYLLMQSLRNKFKKSFRGFKIVLSSSQG